MARELIKIQQEELKPRIICGSCKEEILIDIEPFKADCTKILRDNCPKCNAELFVGVMILAHPKLQGILSIIQTILTALSGASSIVGGERITKPQKGNA